MSTSSAASTAVNKHPSAGQRPVFAQLPCLYRLGVCLALLLAGWQSSTAAESPQSAHCQYADSQPLRIRHVHDGDTVIRADGERLRLIGLDTPEVAREDRPAEAKADAARDHLRQLIHKAKTITARYGNERRDHYGRLLAHLYVDGRNVQAELLAAGLATPLFMAPNLAHVDCYEQATEAARQAKRGLWSLPQYRPRNAGSLSGLERGYHVITGSVRRVGQSRCCIWLNLDSDFALRIERRYLPLFNEYDPAQLLNAKVQARGYINRRSNELRMDIRHPADLTIPSQ